MRFNGFVCVWDQIPVTIFCSKRYFLAREKTECFSIFLRHYVTFVPAGYGKALLELILGCHGRIQRGAKGVRTPPPLKNHKNRVSKQYWSRSLVKSQSYQASIQCWAIIGPPASDITFWIRAWLYFKELYFRKDIQKRLFK